MITNDLKPADLKSRETAFIIHPEEKTGKSKRSVDALIEEASGLARAIGLVISGVEVLKINRINPGYFIGKGQCEAIAHEVKTKKPDVIIFNGNLSPVQQRNLEKAWKAKVIDRTGLILEIFGARAKTKEGRLQVELAALEYQRSRLVRSWTHLERQRGGAGFMGGPGETQIEIDRRMISERITKLKKNLEDVRRTRNLGRKSRENVPLPVVALVGYTNAGKSTLFNKLTDAGVLAEDLPFATLDPTTRRIELPGGLDAVLSDTVGFISDLPTHLVAAFRATLEQITYADVIVHVIDASNPDFEAQKEDVIKILEDMGVEYGHDPRIIELYNKADALPRDARQDLKRKVKFAGSAVLVSALKGQGMDDFLESVNKIISRARREAVFKIPVADGKALAWLYEHTEVMDAEETDKYTALHVMIDPADIGKFKQHYGYEPHPGALEEA